MKREKDFEDHLTPRHLKKIIQELSVKVSNLQTSHDRDSVGQDRGDQSERSCGSKVIRTNHDEERNVRETKCLGLMGDTGVQMDGYS